MDGTLEISTAFTMQGRTEAASWTTREAHARRRRMNSALGLAAILVGSASMWRYGWETVRGYSGGADHVFLELRFGPIMPLPRRAFDAPKSAALRRLADEYGPGARPGASA